MLDYWQVNGCSLRGLFETNGVEPDETLGADRDTAETFWTTVSGSDSFAKAVGSTADTPVRLEKVEAVRSALASGAYVVTTEQLADTLLERMLDRKLGEKKLGEKQTGLRRNDDGDDTKR